MDGESENFLGTANGLSGFDVTSRPFSLGTFFWASKRKYLARKGETNLIWLYTIRRMKWSSARKDEELSPFGELLSLLVQRK